MTAQVLFFNVFFEKDPHINAVEFIATKNIHWHIQSDFIVCILSPMGDGVGVLSPFSEGLYSIYKLCKIGILGGNWHFECRWFFSGGTWKFPVYIKIVTMNLKQKKKQNDSDCNFNRFSLLVPYPNNQRRGG